MERVGVRELRQNLSKHLARVKSGLRIEVTEHGRTVAVLQPPPVEDSLWQSLIDQGIVIPAVAAMDTLPPMTGAADPELSRRVQQALEEQREERL